jgi:hypothetical protein
MQLYGTTFHESLEAVAARLLARDATAGTRSDDQNWIGREKWMTFLARLCVSAIVLAIGAACLLFFREQPELQKIGAGFIGVVAGYWLH